MSFPTGFTGTPPEGKPGTPPEGKPGTPPTGTPGGKPPETPPAPKTLEEALAALEAVNAEQERLRVETATAKREAQERKEKLRQYEKEQTEAERLKQVEDEKALAEQNKFKELSDQRAATITTHENTIKAKDLQITDLTTRVARYEEVLNKSVEAQTKDLPKHIAALLEKLDPADKLQWLAENAKALNIKPKDGVPPTPPPDGKGPTEEQKTQALAEQALFTHNRL